jgi:hypothetical protein
LSFFQRTRDIKTTPLSPPTLSKHKNPRIHQPVAQNISPLNKYMEEVAIEKDIRFKERKSFALPNRLTAPLIAILTAICMSSTIFFAYNSSLEEPHLAPLVAKNPARTILILNVMSQVTLFALAELTTLVMDATRWALACSNTGISALTFLTLSQATSLLGVLYLSVGNGRVGGKFRRNEHRIWGAQRSSSQGILLTSRLFLTLIRAALGVVLLSDVSFKATYHELQEFPLLQTGLSSMDTSLLEKPEFQYIATGDFWWHFPSMMSYAHVVSPVSCSGDFCQSFYFPGPISLVKFQPGTPEITSADCPPATTFVQKNSPGYQIEFYPIDSSVTFPFGLDDCRVLGISLLALQICLKKIHSSTFMAGSLFLSPLFNCSLECLSADSCKRKQLSKQHGLAHEYDYANKYDDDRNKAARHNNF